MGKWRELYDWLGEEIAGKDSVADDMSTSDRMSDYWGTVADAYRDVREEMRRKDPSLPIEEIDDP